MSSKQHTVLIVDDTPDNISILSGLLKERYKTKIATSGQKALQIANIAPAPDLILLDVMMPEMDGYETIQQLKANPQTSDIPVIFLSAKAQVHDEEKGLGLGAADYIFKPISPSIVMARVATQIALLQAQHFNHACINVLAETLGTPTQLDAMIGAIETRKGQSLSPAVVDDFSECARQQMENIA